MKHLIEHDLDVATAKKVTDHAFAAYKTQFAAYEPTLRWVSELRAEIGFNAKGIRVSGAFVMTPTAISVDLDVPFLLRPFQKRAIDVIEREVKTWVAKAKAGEI